MATQAERRASTRRRILAAARARFERQGWAATSIGDVLDDAGISRGALYHHFSGKEQLFAAVYSAVSAEAVERAAAAAPPHLSARDALAASCAAWLDIVREPMVAQVLLVDGPAALGWDRARRLEQETSLDAMRTALDACRRSGDLSFASLDAVALLVNALLAEAALASAGGEPVSSDAMFETIVRMIDGLSPRPGG